MKKILLILVLFSIVVIAGCNNGQLLEDKDKRCEMEKPIEVGDCEPINGYYYDKISNACEILSGCSLEGEAPFDAGEKELCEEICVE